ncbi:unnamed protein product, partial [Rhizoctonia solani]
SQRASKAGSEITTIISAGTRVHPETNRRAPKPYPPISTNSYLAGSALKTGLSCFLWCRMRSVARRAWDRKMASVKLRLEDLSKEQLIARIYELERQLPAQSRRSPQTVQNPFPFSQHPTRKIALKFTYAGWLYNGLAAQSQPTPLATVEQVLFDALVNTRLVDPDKGMEGCGWSRCGRTDRGVSSAGQVVSLWVRSALGARSICKKNESLFDQEDSALAPDSYEESLLTFEGSALPLLDVYSTALDASLPPTPPLPPPSVQPNPKAKQAKKETKQELAYIHMLNRVLPSSIRVLAWSPVADDFDARFSCQWRHYKYFFSKGGQALDGMAGAGVGRAVKGQGGAGEEQGEAGRGEGRAGLDVGAMRDAASRLIGEHDFRNFCKLDPSKQIENFNRRVLGAWIERVQDDHGEDELGSEEIVADSQEGLYVFNLKGTAFLWHQVRCIMAVLFLVGQRLEHSSIIDDLLHTSHSSSKSLGSAPIESKPNYTLADSLPLVLWDCGYKAEDVAWQTDHTAQTKQGVTQDRERTNNFWFNMYSIWTHDRIQTTMQMYFLRAAERFYPTPSPSFDRGLVRLNTGGGVYRHTTRYIPIHDLDRGERAEIANAKWRDGATGQRRIAKRNSKAKNTNDE